MSQSKEKCTKQLLKQFDFVNQFTIEASSDCGIYQTGSTVEVHTIHGELRKGKGKLGARGGRIIQVKAIQRFQLW